MNRFVISGDEGDEFTDTLDVVKFVRRASDAAPLVVNVLPIDIDKLVADAVAKAMRRQ